MSERDLRRILNGLNQDPDLWKRDNERPKYRQQEILHWIAKKQSDDQIAEKIASTRGSVYNQRLAIYAMFQPFGLSLDDASIRTRIEALFKEKLPSPIVSRRNVPWPHYDFEIEDGATAGSTAAGDDSGASRDQPQEDLAAELFAGAVGEGTSTPSDGEGRAESGDGTDGGAASSSTPVPGSQDGDDEPRSRIAFVILIALAILLAAAIIAGGIFFVRWGQQNLFCPVLGIGCETPENQDLAGIETEPTQESIIEPATPQTIVPTEEAIVVDADAIRTEAAMTIAARVEAQEPLPSDTLSVPTNTPTPTKTPTPTHTPTPTDTAIPTITPTPGFGLPFSEDFNSLEELDTANIWTVIDGVPAISDGRLTGAAGGLTLEIGNETLSDYAIHIRYDGMKGGTQQANFFTWNNIVRLRFYGLGYQWEVFEEGGWQTARIDHNRGIPSTGTIRVFVDGNKYTVNVDGEYLTEYDVGPPHVGPVRITLFQDMRLDTFRIDPLDQ